jgi:hypothetical protein
VLAVLPQQQQGQAIAGTTLFFQPLPLLEAVVEAMEMCLAKMAARAVAVEMARLTPLELEIRP